MYELTIDGKVYQFKFGMGFLREMNKKVSAPVVDAPGIKQEIGARYYISKMINGDVDALVEILDVANKTQTPRITKEKLDAYIEDDNTDIDTLFKEVLDFLKQSNATKKTVAAIQEAIKKAKEKEKSNR